MTVENLQRENTALKILMDKLKFKLSTLNITTCVGCKYEEYEQSHYCETCTRSAYVSDNYEKMEV